MKERSVKVRLAAQEGNQRLVPVMWPYRVLGVNGATLGEFFKLSDAEHALDQWPNASSVVIGSILCLSKQGGAA